MKSHEIHTAVSKLDRELLLVETALTAVVSAIKLGEPLKLEEFVPRIRNSAHRLLKFSNQLSEELLRKGL